MTNNYLDRSLAKLAQLTIENRKMLRTQKRQRRVSFEDLYGVQFTAQGDGTSPARFFISVSPDFEYYERFALKFVIEPFKSSVTGVSGSGMSIGETSLSGGGTDAHVIENTSTLDENGAGVTPNPHTHSVSGTIGGLDYGVKVEHTQSVDWLGKIDGVDITPYLIEQFDGYWINGEGTYPDDFVDESRKTDYETFFDILDVACLLNEEDETSKLQKLLRPGFKPVEIYSDRPFSVSAYLYMKYNNMNR